MIPNYPEELLHDDEFRRSEKDGMLELLARQRKRVEEVLALSQGILQKPVTIQFFQRDFRTTTLQDELDRFNRLKNEAAVFLFYLGFSFFDLEPEQKDLFEDIRIGPPPPLF